MKNYIVEKYSFTIWKSEKESYTVYFAQVLEVDELRIEEGHPEFNEANVIAGIDESLHSKEPYEQRCVEDQIIFTNAESALDYYNDYTIKSTK